MKNFLLNIRQFNAITMSVVCLSGVMGILPAAPAVASSAAYIFGVNAAPIISSFDVTAAIGSTISIHGSNFTGTTEVRFGSLAATTFSVVSNELITVTVPSAATIGNLTVVNPDGSASTTTAFTPYVTWNGGTGLWNVASNWGNNQIPTATTNVIINSGFPTVNSAATCNNLTVQAGVTFRVQTGAALNVSGLFVNSGTFNQTDGNVTLTGVFSNQGGFSQTGGNITFAAASGEQFLPALTYHNLTIAGSGEKILQGNTTITSSLNFTGSNLKTIDPSNVLTLNGSVSGEDNNHSFIGRLVKTRTVSGVITDNFGNIGIGFTNTGGGNWGSVVATRITGQSVANPYNNTQRSINRYWTISPSNPNTNTAVTLTLTWLTSETNNLTFPTNQAQAWRKETSDFDWTAVDTMQTIAANGNERSITVSTNHFSTWAITDQMSTLPVSMIYFNGKATGSGSQLNWATASEKNSEVFVVERSVNGKDFETIGSVKAAGSSNQKITYSFTDRTVQTNATAYYRLRQVDLDGTFEYSAIVTIAGNKGAELSAVAYPNPFNESLNLKLNTGISKGEVIIRTIDGKEVYRQAVNENAPVNNLTLKNLPKLNSGFYLLSLVANNKTTVLKVAQQ